MTTKVIGRRSTSKTAGRAHTEDNSGGEENDVASGGVSESTHDDDDTSRNDDLERDVHGDPDAAR